MSSVLNPSTPIFVPGTDKVLFGSSDGSLYQVDVSGSNLTSVLLDASAVVGTPSFDPVTGLIYVGTDMGVIFTLTFPLP